MLIELLRPSVLPSKAGVIRKRTCCMRCDPLLAIQVKMGNVQALELCRLQQLKLYKVSKKQTHGGSPENAVQLLGE